MLVSCWWLFSIVVAATYSGNLIAFLTVDKTKPLFTTLKDLLEQDVYRWGFLGGSAIHHTVRASNSSLYSAIWVGVKKWLSQNPDHLATNISLHYQRLLHGDYAFVSDRATFDRWTANRCDLELAKETFLPTEYGVGLPNDSAFTRVFSSEILMMHENGWLEKVREKWWPHQSFCEPSTTTRSTPITLVHVQSLFYILLIGAFLALVALSVEYFVMLPAWAKLRKSLLLQKALRNDGQTEGK